VIVIVWQIVIAIFRPHVSLLPPPLLAAHELWALLATGELAVHTATSLARVFSAWAITAAIAIPLGLAMGWSRRIERIVDPFVEIFRPISPLAWIPLAILWFGVDNLTAIFLIFVASSLPIMVAVMSAVHHIPVVNLRAGRNFGLNGLQLMRHVIYPAVMPRLLVGLRLALGISWLVVVAAEMISVRSGLGFLIIDSRNAGNRYDLIVAGMVMIGAIGVVLDLGMRQLEKLKSVRWGYQGTGRIERVRRAAARSA
jgi:NitT/TauT family transport system permease protein